MNQDDNKTTHKINTPYNVPSWFYDLRGYFILRLTYRSRLKPLIQFFSEHIGNTHLEGAIGSGTFFKMVLKAMKKKGKPLPQIVKAFDYSPTMLNGAKKRFKKYQNIEIIQADVTQLPYADNTFDTCCVANAIHCFADINKSLQELHRVLKPGGTLAANVLIYPSGSKLSVDIANRINNWGIKKGVLYTPYHVDDIKAKIKTAGFDIVEEHATGNMLDFVAAK